MHFAPQYLPKSKITFAHDVNILLEISQEGFQHHYIVHWCVSASHTLQPPLSARRLYKRTGPGSVLEAAIEDVVETLLADAV